MGMVYDEKAYAVAGRVELIQQSACLLAVIHRICDTVPRLTIILAAIGTTIQVAVSEVLLDTI